MALIFYVPKMHHTPSVSMLLEGILTVNNSLICGGPIPKNFGMNLVLVISKSRVSRLELAVRLLYFGNQISTNPSYRAGALH